MHDPRDPDGLVRDEIDQRRSSGYDVSAIDLAGLTPAETFARLESLAKVPDWSYDEPDDPEAILARLGAPTQSRGAAGELADRIAGAWFGRCAGCLLGKPIETWPTATIERYLRDTDQWPPDDYLLPVDTEALGLPPFKPSWPKATRGRIAGMPRDDDVDYTVLGLHLLEAHGPRFTLEDVAAELLDHLPFTQVFTAERVAYSNLVSGTAPEATAVTLNPYREWIGALIRADIHGLTSPGNPRLAAAQVIRDASLTHTGNGVYAAMWAAGAIAAAAAGESPRDVVRFGLGQVPPGSRSYAAIRSVVDAYETGIDWEAALARLHLDLGHYSWAHAINNAAAIAAAVLWGGGDFGRTVGLAVAAGWDTDSCGATAGSIAGAFIGRSSLPARWVDPLGDRLETAVFGFQGVTISELADRTTRLATSPAPLVA